MNTLDEILTRARQLGTALNKLRSATQCWEEYKSLSPLNPLKADEHLEFIRAERAFTYVAANETAALVSALEMMCEQNRMIQDALRFYAEGWHYRIAEHESLPRDGVTCEFEEGEKGRDALDAAKKLEQEWVEKHGK